MTKKLSDKQQRFLDVLFTEGVEGDFETAKQLAGYSQATPVGQITKSIEEEVLAETRRYISSLAPKAAVGLNNLLTDPKQLGAKDRLAVVKDVLDRVGLSKTEKLEVTGNALFILPPKDGDDDGS
jgi:hypothetical protein